MGLEEVQAEIMPYAPRPHKACTQQAKEETNCQSSFLDAEHLVAQKCDQRVVGSRARRERLQAALGPAGEACHALHRGRRQVKHVEVLAPARRHHLTGEQMYGAAKSTGHSQDAGMSAMASLLAVYASMLSNCRRCAAQLSVNAGLIIERSSVQA